jgi:hypothetical protein
MLGELIYRYLSRMGTNSSIVKVFPLSLGP